MNNNANHESVAELYVFSYVNPFRLRKLILTVICALLSVIPVVQLAASAFAFSPNRKGIPAKAGRMLGVSFLMTSPSLAFFGALLFLLTFPVKLLYIPHYMLLAGMIVTGVSAAVRLPVAMAHIGHGGSLREALDGRFIKRLIGASVGRYIAACVGLLPLALASGFYMIVPWWFVTAGAVFLQGLSYFVMGTLFGAQYRAAMAICGFEVQEGPEDAQSASRSARPRPQAAVAMVLALIMPFQVIPPVSTFAQKGRTEQEFNEQYAGYLTYSFPSRRPVPAEFRSQYVTKRDRLENQGRLHPGQECEYALAPSFGRGTLLVRATTITSDGRRVDLKDYVFDPTYGEPRKDGNAIVNIADSAIGFIPYVGTAYGILKGSYYAYEATTTDNEGYAAEQWDKAKYEAIGAGFSLLGAIGKGMQKYWKGIGKDAAKNVDMYDKMLEKG